MSEGKKKVGSIGTSTPWKGFAFSCVACCSAEVVTCPIDVVKVRLQLQGELGAKRVYSGAFNAATQIFRTEGASALWKGVSPALLRQATYGSLRYGSYEPIKGLFGVDADGNCHLWKKIAAGAVTGICSSAVANPADLVKVRLQADMASGKDGAARRSMLSTFKEVYRADGLMGFYRGVAPASSRACVGAMTELACYDEIKSTLLSSGFIKPNDSQLKVHVSSALGAGLLSCFCMNPFDVVRSRLMNSSKGEGRYTGMMDCFFKTVRSEGVTSLWKGFFPSYARIGPRVVIIFVILEKMREVFD